jgi:hypothetical protein
LRGRKLRSDRYAVAVDHHHALRTFPTTGFADCGALFLAVTKVASTRLLPNPAAGAGLTSTTAFAMLFAIRLAPPSYAIDANRSPRPGIARACRAIALRYEDPTKCLPRSRGWLPRADHGRPCDAWAQETTAPESSIVLRLTTPAASS